jgi:divalent metal cation (Fe/Co/Zn/Cd) transporter
LDLRAFAKRFLTVHTIVGFFLGAITMWLLIFYFIVVIAAVIGVAVFYFLFREKIHDLIDNPKEAIKQTAKDVLKVGDEIVKRKRGPNKQCVECKAFRGHKPDCSQAKKPEVQTA